jgi:hypothetical protein
MILVLDRTDLLSTNSLVSIFQKQVVDVDRSHEVFAGLGVVETVTEEGRPQIVVFHEASGSEDVWERARRRDGAAVAAVAALVIRPGADYRWVAEWSTRDE